jgi:copper transport protein
VTGAGPADRAVRGLAALAGALCLAVALATPSAAHAELLLASPAPGTGLPQAPAWVVIHFTEPLNLALSRIEVLDASEMDVTSGPTAGVAGDARAMQRPLGYLPVGRYVVRWTTVSEIDGHTLRGSYDFAVGAAAAPGETVADSPIDSEGWLGLSGRLVALLGMGLWFGGALLNGVAERAGVAERPLRVLAIAAPAAVAVGGAASLGSSALVATGSLSALGGVVASTSGQLRLVSAALGVAGVGVAAVSAAATARGHGRGRIVHRAARPVALVLAGAALLAEAGSGHAAGTPSVPVAVGSFAVHLASIGAWLFAIAASLLAGRRLVGALAAFTPFALAAAGVTAASGALNGYLSLDEPAQLVDTAYGLVLVAKTIVFAAMVTLGATHWLRRRATPSAVTSAAPAAPARSAVLRGVRLPVRGEALSAVIAIALATVLVGFPNPPRETEAAGNQVGPDSVLATLATRPAASVAVASGPWVVGVTVLPPEPGPLEVRVQVLGVEPGDGLRDARLRASSEGAAPVEANLGACGLGCFAGPATLAHAGSWTLAVSIGSNRGEIAVSTALPLPAPDGAAELARARSAMDALSAAHLHETLAGSVGGTTVTAEYDFTAPDAMQISVGSSVRIVIGTREWSREGPDAEWSTSPWPGLAFSWPTGYLDAFWGAPVAPRVIGQETVDGHPSTIVTFFRPDLPAWFRLWIGVDDGLVRREEMLAESHIMEDSYSELDGPIRVTPPS